MIVHVTIEKVNINWTEDWDLDRLEGIGILPSYFSGYFAYIKIEDGTVQNGNRGCELYVSCRDEDHCQEVKTILQKRYNPKSL